MAALFRLARRSIWYPRILLQAKTGHYRLRLAAKIAEKPSSPKCAIGVEASWKSLCFLILSRDHRCAGDVRRKHDLWAIATTLANRLTWRGLADIRGTNRKGLNETVSRAAGRMFFDRQTTNETKESPVRGAQQAFRGGCDGPSELRRAYEPRMLCVTHAMG